jgi:glycosyltransferase involved in cell wall biosynthesis
VTGYVEDVRDFLAAADVCVVPLRIARGIQNKVLEAMAMAKAVVCTPQALEGIKAVPGRDVLVEYGDEGFAASVIRLLTDHAFLERTGQLARQCVEEGYAWDANLSQLERMITPLEPSKQELRVGGLI